MNVKVIGSFHTGTGVIVPVGATGRVLRQEKDTLYVYFRGLANVLRIPIVNQFMAVEVQNELPSELTNDDTKAN